MGASVLELVEVGEEGAASALLDRYGGLVWSLARRFCADQSEAEDAVQEIMIDVWRSAKRGMFDPSKGSDTTFVATIARRRLIDRLRRRKATVALAVDVEQEPARAPAVETAEDVRAVAAALEGLSDPQQRTIRMAVLHGLTHEQIAESTGMPLGTVKTHIRRGLIRLREAVLAGRDSGEGVAR